MTRFVHRLTAPAPGWTINADVIVVGSGVAGLSAALELRSKVDRVLVVTKGKLASGSTVWAQGGIAAALDPEDTPQEHLEDTLVAGAGLCSEDAVRALVTEGPARVRELMARGAHFDTGPNGDINLTREGGHHRDRIVHAGGDATGAEISRALVAQLDAIRNDPGIEVIEGAMVVDLLTAAPLPDGRPGKVCGVTLHVIGQGTRDGVGAALAKAVIVATGGIGQVFRSSTNPASATGDGIATAIRAGAAVADIEFVQFHPTVLWEGSGARGQLPLISEAVRGEGAYLLNADGERFMVGRHELAELAPRDVVSKAIVAQMKEDGSDNVFLDCRHLGSDFLAERFPTIWARLTERGIDMGHDLIPVAPAQHFHSAGTATINVVHDAHWNPENVPNAGYLACYNNKGVSSNASCGDQVSPPYDGYNYSITPGSAYTPGSYTLRQPSGGYNSNMGNIQVLPNGNTIITIATAGVIKEFDPSGVLLWSKTASGATPKAFRYDSCYVFNQAPAIPTVTEVNDTLYSSPAVTYQWYFNGYQIAGANDQFYVPTQTGNYKVRITDINGCVLQYSIDYIYTISSGINEAGNTLDLKIYPNPTNGIIIIQHKYSSENFDVRVTDETGRILLQDKNTQYLDLSGFETGIYFVTVIHSDGQQSTKRISFIR